MDLPRKKPASPRLRRVLGAALSELESFDSDLMFKRVPYPSEIAECHDLWFTGVGGARLYAKYLRPKVQLGQSPGVVSFHC